MKSVDPAFYGTTGGNSKKKAAKELEALRQRQTKRGSVLSQERGSGISLESLRSVTDICTFIKARLMAPMASVPGDATELKWPGLARLVNSTFFESIMGIIICVNCLTIGIEVHLCPPVESNRIPVDDCPTEWVNISEHVCVAIFVCEFFLIGLSTGFSQYYRSSVRAVDGCLVWVVGVGFSWILPAVAQKGTGQFRFITALRAFRLLRILRVVRFQFKDIWRLFLGMARSAKTLASMICVVVFVNYLFGILGVVLIGDAPKLQDLEGSIMFKGLDQAMFTLVQIVTGDGWASQIARPIMARSHAMWIFFIAYIAVGTLVLMNLMTAIIVENAMEMSKEDEEHQLYELAARKQKEFGKLRRVFEALDMDESDTIDEDEFAYAYEERPDIVDKFKLLDFDDKDFQRLFNDLDNGDGVLQIDEFLDGVVRMQGWARSKDLIRTQKSVERLHARMDILFDLIDRDGKGRRNLGMRGERLGCKKEPSLQHAMSKTSSIGSKRHYTRSRSRLPSKTSEKSENTLKSENSDLSELVKSPISSGDEEKSDLRSPSKTSESPENAPATKRLSLNSESPIRKRVSVSSESPHQSLSSAAEYQNVPALIEKSMEQLYQRLERLVQTKCSGLEQTMEQMYQELQIHRHQNGAAQGEQHSQVLPETDGRSSLKVVKNSTCGTPKLEFDGCLHEKPSPVHGPVMGLAHLEGKSLVKLEFDVEEHSEGDRCNQPHGTRAVHTPSTSTFSPAVTLPRQPDNS